MTIGAVHRLATRWVARCDVLFAACGNWAREGVAGSTVPRRTYAEWSARWGELAAAWRYRLPVIPHDPPSMSADESAAVETMTAQLTEQLAAGPTAIATTVSAALRAVVDDDERSVDELVDGPTAALLERTRAELSAAGDAFSVPPSAAPTRR